MNTISRLLVPFVLGALASAQCRPDAPPVDGPTIARLVAQLADRDDDRARAAEIALMKRGRFAVRPLMHALDGDPKVRLRERIERVLEICRIDAPVVDGLKIGLTTTATALALGDELTIRTTLCNLTDEPLVLFAGMSFSGNRFENGSALTRVQRLPNGEVIRTGVVWNMGFCGTGATAVWVRVEPWSARTFECPAELTNVDTPDTPSGSGRRLLFAAGWPYLPTPEPGSQILQASLHIEKPADQPAAATPGWPVAKLPEGRRWYGDATSNEVRIELR